METYPFFPLKSKKMALRLLLDFSGSVSFFEDNEHPTGGLRHLMAPRCYNGARNSR